MGAGRAAGALEAISQRAMRSAMSSINRKCRAGGQPSTQGGLAGEQAPNLIPSKLGFEQQWALPNAQEPLFQLISYILPQHTLWLHLPMQITKINQMAADCVRSGHLALRVLETLAIVTIKIIFTNPTSWLFFATVLFLFWH